jgi:hypothetical protein
MREPTCCSSEEAKSRKDVRGREGLKTKIPVVPRSAVNENKSIAISADGNTVSKCNVHVDCVEIFVFTPIEWFAAMRLGDRGIRANRGRELATIDPRAIPADLKEMLVIAKFATAHGAVEFLRRPMRLFIRSVGSIAGANR